MRGAVAGLVAATALAAFAAGDAAASVDYATAPFQVSTHPHTFGQAPVFLPNGSTVAFGQNFRQGAGNQVYLQNLDGTGLRCLTCTGPGSQKSNVNGVPAVRPQGDWMLFHSWRGHSLTIGSPGYGGMGSELWVMRPDGSHQTQLTGLDTAHGAGDGEDDYHAYWSPDGRHIEWAHLSWNFVTGSGQGKWDVRVADFVDDSSGPHLTNIRVVRPANGHWYETQWWSPDGKGFLYTETSGTVENPELFYCRLTASGCEVTQLTNDPSWDEQALFTPDGKNVIFMSSRAQPGAFNSFAQLGQQAGLSNDEDYLLILPLFEAGFLQPFGQETTDLYEVNLATRAVRRLTTDGNDGWITPEFTWDPTNRYLLWTENRFPSGFRYPFPPDAGGYLRSLATILESPPVPGAEISPNGVGVAPIPLEQRTRIGVFPAAPSAGGQCVDRRKFTFRVHHAPRARVTEVEVFLNGKRVLRRRGHAIGRVTVKRLPTGTFRMRIVATQSTSSRLVSTRTYRGCIKGRPRTRGHHAHAR